METKRRPAQSDDRAPHDMLAKFACPVGDARDIQIVRPFSVLSRNTYSAPVTLPIGAAYLAATLEAAGYSVGLIDGLGEDIMRIEAGDGPFNVQGASLERILGMIPDGTALIGISLMFSQEWVAQRALVKAIRTRFPDAWIVVGGEHVTALTEYVLRDAPEIDFAVTGEGELSLLQLTHALFTGASRDEIAGLCWLDADGAFQTNGPGRRITGIGDLPRPAWHLCKVRNYFIDNWTMGIAMGRNMPIVATRGCPYQCTFCSNPTMWTTRYVMRPVSEVVDEIEWLVREYDANSIDFFDLTAIVKREWILEFCAELKRRRLSIVWQLPSGTRSEALDGETLRALLDAGCRLLVYAPESGSQETLTRIKKKMDLKRLVDSVRQAVRIGHTVKINLIIGFPDETPRDVLKTVYFAFRMALIGVDDCNIAIFSPYPGSELYRRLLAEGKLPPASDGYLNGLVAQFDFTNATAFCQSISGRTLSMWRVVGHALFYATAYLGHPGRLIGLLRRLKGSRFQAANLFEQRISDALARRRNKSGPSANA